MAKPSVGVSLEAIGQKVKQIMNEMYQSLNKQFRVKSNFPSTEILQILLATVKVQYSTCNNVGYFSVRVVNVHVHVYLFLKTFLCVYIWFIYCLVLGNNIKITAAFSE